MKTKTGILLIWLTTTALLYQSGPRANAQAQEPDVKRTSSPPQRNDTKPTSTKGQSTVVRDRVPGSFLSPDGGLRRISGKVNVLNAHTLAFDDGTEIELNGGMDAPELDQKGLIGDAFYPCGKEAAEFLRKMIGDRRVTCFVFGNKGNKVRGDCFIGETKLEIEMVRNGWALAHHEGMEAWEAIARENKRGLWRGTFVAPERWRKGERLPGE